MAKSMSLKDRRKHERYPISVVFDILEGPAALEGQGQGAIMNLSEGGAAFASDAFLEAGQKVYFEIPVPVRVWGKVLRVRREGVKTQYAVEFEKVRLADKKLLQTLVDKAKLTANVK